MRKSVINFNDGKIEKKSKANFNMTFEEIRQCCLNNGEFTLLKEYVENCWSKDTENLETSVLQIFDLCFENGQIQILSDINEHLKDVKILDTLSFEVSLLFQMFENLARFITQKCMISYSKFVSQKSYYFYIQNFSAQNLQKKIEDFISKAEKLSQQNLQNIDFKDKQIFVSKSLKNFQGLKFFNHEKIAQIVNGKNHALILTKNNQLYGFGKNDFQQISPFYQQSQIDSTFQINFFVDFLIKKEYVCKIFAKQNCSALQTSENNIILWGNFIVKNNFVFISNCKAKFQIIILQNEIILLSRDGTSYKLKITELKNLCNLKDSARGCIKFQFDQEDFSKILIPVLNSDNIVVQDLSYSDNHILIISDQNELYGYGDNQKKQLNSNSRNFVNSIEKVDNFYGEKVYKCFALDSLSIVKDSQNYYQIFGQISKNKITKYPEVMTINSEENEYSFQTQNRQIYAMSENNFKIWTPIEQSRFRDSTAISSLYPLQDFIATDSFFVFQKNLQFVNDYTLTLSKQNILTGEVNLQLKIITEDNNDFQGDVTLKFSKINPNKKKLQKEQDYKIYYDNINFKFVLPYQQLNKDQINVKKENDLYCINIHFLERGIFQLQIFFNNLLIPKQNPLIEIRGEKQSKILDMLKTRPELSQNLSSFMSKKNKSKKLSTVLKSQNVIEKKSKSKMVIRNQSKNTCKKNQLIKPRKLSSNLRKSAPFGNETNKKILNHMIQKKKQLFQHIFEKK